MPKETSVDNFHWWVVFLGITFLGAATRLYKIEEPDHVCWDETHFGKMASWYINHTFFFDVHPPLAKMLIGFAGKVTGYNGTFPFNKPGDKYLDHNYLGMRLFCVFHGIFIIPFCFLIVWEMTYSLSASALAATFIIFDVGMITLSQYILLDPILMYFIIGSVLGMVKFRAQSDRPFSLVWWFWLSWTGVFMACSISVKFVGLFVIVLVGLHTLNDLWIILGDLETPIIQVVKHFVARALCLIVLPALLYISFFYIHLKTLYKSGSGDGFFSSAFQSQLEGNSLYHTSMPRDVAYGAVVTLKNYRTGGGYLHSHWHLYPEGVGARQQQVTAYSHKDENNKWMIKKFDSEPDLSANDSPIQLVMNGDLIRLEHAVTKRNLHSHKEAAPITKRHQQVTCYGENGTGDANDVWKIEIIGEDLKIPISTVTSKLRLIHYLTGCALHSDSKQLPKWGYEQMEVSCNANLRDTNNMWNIEDNYFPRLPNVSFEVYAPSFLERFLESHAVMFQGNSGLKPKEGEITSRPWQWPINLRGQFFSGQELRIYLLGNPIIWWGNLFALQIFFILKLVFSVCEQRGLTLSPFLKGGEGAVITAASSVIGIGNDIAGSIRIPASFCGIYGHKPSRDVVPNWGMFPYGEMKTEKEDRTIDFVSTGPMCRYVQDLPLLLKTLSGNDERLRLDTKVNFKNVKIYYIEEYPGILNAAVPDVKKSIKTAVKHFSDEHGIQATPLICPELQYGFYIWESKLLEHDGPPFQFYLKGKNDKINMWLELFKSIVRSSEHTLPAIYFGIVDRRKKDNFYEFCLEQYKAIERKFKEIFEEDAILLVPTHPEPPPHYLMTIPMYPNIAYTCIFNILGFPSTQIPAGLSNGAPIGIQAVSGPFKDHLSLAAAAELDKVFNGWISPCPVDI